MTAEDEKAKLEARVRRLEHDVASLQRAVAKLIMERSETRAPR